MSQDPAERGRGPYAVAAAGLLAPWGVIKDLPSCLRDRTQVTRSRGAVGIRSAGWPHGSHSGCDDGSRPFRY